MKTIKKQKKKMKRRKKVNDVNKTVYQKTEMKL